MIGMAMGQERVMDVGGPDARRSSWVKMALPPPASTKQGLLAVMKDETRVVTARGPGIAGSENKKLFHKHPLKVL